MGYVAGKQPAIPGYLALQQVLGGVHCYTSGFTGTMSGLCMAIRFMWGYIGFASENPPFSRGLPRRMWSSHSPRRWSPYLPQGTVAPNTLCTSISAQSHVLFELPVPLAATYPKAQAMSALGFGTSLAQRLPQ